MILAIDKSYQFSKPQTSNSLAIVKLLISVGADPGVGNPDDGSPLGTLFDKEIPSHFVDTINAIKGISQDNEDDFRIDHLRMLVSEHHNWAMEMADLLLCHGAAGPNDEHNTIVTIIRSMRRMCRMLESEEHDEELGFILHSAYTLFRDLIFLCCKHGRNPNYCTTASIELIHIIEPSTWFYWSRTEETSVFVYYPDIGEIMLDIFSILLLYAVPYANEREMLEIALFPNLSSFLTLFLNSIDHGPWLEAIQEYHAIIRRNHLRYENVEEDNRHLYSHFNIRNLMVLARLVIVKCVKKNGDISLCLERLSLPAPIYQFMKKPLR